MKKTYIVAKYAFLEVYRSKVMLSIVFIALGIMITSYVASEFAYGAPAKVALDCGYGLASISNLIMAIFIGSTLLNREIENRTLYMVLSRPISRTMFMLGKVFGLSIVLVINSIVLSAITILIFKFLGGEVASIMFWTAWFSLLEAFLIMLFSVLFSLMTNSSLAVVYSIIIMITGHSMAATSKLIITKNSVYFNSIIQFFSFIIPDLEKINLKDLMIYQQNISMDYVIKAQAYVSIYALAILLVISYVFKNKNLD